MGQLVHNAPMYRRQAFNKRKCPKEQRGHGNDELNYIVPKKLNSDGKECANK